MLDTKGATIALALALLVGIPASTLAAAPTNDDFDNRESIDISSLPVTVTASNVDATTQPGEPDPCTRNDLSKTVWYTFTPSTDKRIDIETAGSDFDTIAALYTGSSLSDLEAVACSDDPNDRRAEFTVSVEAGTTYQLQIGGDNDDSGSIELTIDTEPETVTTSYLGTTAGLFTTCGYLISPNVGGGSCLLGVGGVSTLDFDLEDENLAEDSILVGFEFYDLSGSSIGATFSCGDASGLAVPSAAEQVSISTGDLYGWAEEEGDGLVSSGEAPSLPPCQGFGTRGSWTLTFNN